MFLLSSEDVICDDSGSKGGIIMITDKDAFVDAQMEALSHDRNKEDERRLWTNHRTEVQIYPIITVFYVLSSLKEYIS